MSSSATYAECTDGWIVWLASTIVLLLVVERVLNSLHESFAARTIVAPSRANALDHQAAMNFEQIPELKQVGNLGDWELACRLADPQPLNVFQELCDGHFGLRFLCEVEAGAAECMALVREVDLIPSWNPFCKWGQVERLDGPMELWAAAILALPWPVPRFLVQLHARLLSYGDSSLVCIAKTPDVFDALVSNAEARALRPLPLELAVCHLQPVQVAAGAPPRTSLDIMLRIDLKRISFLGGAAAVPQWLFKLLLSVVVPFVWRRAQRLLREGLRHGERHAQRISLDETGVYRQIRTIAKQRALFVAQ